MITVIKGTKELNGRTIDPAQGFNINDNTVTLYDFKRYNSSSHNTSAACQIMSQDDNHLLIHVSSIDWHKGNPYPYTTQGSFFIHSEKGKRGKVQLGADRVPSTVTNIQDAISFLTPASVKKAQAEGKKVKRQGDFFFIESKKTDLSQLANSNHKPIETKKGISIQHPEHLALSLGIGNWKAVQRKTMNHIKAD